MNIIAVADIAKHPAIVQFPKLRTSVVNTSKFEYTVYHWWRSMQKCSLGSHTPKTVQNIEYGMMDVSHPQPFWQCSENSTIVLACLPMILYAIELMYP